MNKQQIKCAELSERLIDFAVRVIKLCEALPNTKSAKHIANQLLRSGTSAAPNYGEAMSAESRSDFIHKLKIALKELRETDIWLKIIAKAEFMEVNLISPLMAECNELIAIFNSSVITAKKNAKKGQ